MSADEIIDKIEEKAIETGSMDHIKYIEWSKAIIEFAEFILGMLIVVIIILVPLVIMLEVVYINVPISRNVFDKIRGGNNRIARVAQFALRDAVEAVEKVYIGESTGNVNITYCYIKIKSLMVIGFGIALVIQGTSMMINTTYGVVGKALEYLINLLP